VQPATLRLADLTSLVRPELDRLNHELLEELRPEQPELQPLIERALGFRGKQLRPALVFLTARAVAPNGFGNARRSGTNGHGAASSRDGSIADGHAGGTSLDVLISVAKTVELIHTASLVHDDVLDGASMRRQLQTLNAMHGTEAPVLLGDYVYARAFALAVSLDDPTCGRVLGEVVRRMCQGEITQILHRFDFDWTEDRYLDVIHDKTATLYAASSRLGAHYAGGDAQVVEAMDRYGREFGIAFQIIDDCLDLVGDEEVVGKSLGTDLYRGKLTLPLLGLMQDPDQARRLRELVEQGDPTDEQAGREKLARLRDEFPLREAIGRSVAVAHERIHRALAALDVLRPSPARDQLSAIAEYVLTRKL
jgi:octaprenyl-diphosphate synthase